MATLIAEVAGHLTMAPVSAVHTVPITQGSSLPTVEGGEPHPKQSSKFTTPCTGRQAGIEDLKAIQRSPQASIVLVLSL